MGVSQETPLSDGWKLTIVEQSETGGTEKLLFASPIVDRATEFGPPTSVRIHGRRGGRQRPDVVRPCLSEHVRLPGARSRTSGRRSTSGSCATRGLTDRAGGRSKGEAFLETAYMLPRESFPRGGQARPVGRKTSLPHLLCNTNFTEVHRKASATNAHP